MILPYDLLQRIRAQASWKAERCGWKVTSPGANIAANRAPAEYQSGSPVTSTATRRPRRPRISSTMARKGLGQWMR